MEAVKPNKVGIVFALLYGGWHTLGDLGRGGFRPAAAELRFLGAFPQTAFRRRRIQRRDCADPHRSDGGHRLHHRRDTGCALELGSSLGELVGHPKTGII